MTWLLLDAKLLHESMLCYLDPQEEASIKFELKNNSIENQDRFDSQSRWRIYASVN